MAPQLAASRAQLVGGPPTGVLSSQGSAFTGRSCGSLPLQPFLPKKATSQPAVRADASRVGKKEKRAIAASASKSGGSVIDKPEGTQVIERGSNSAANGALRNGFPVRRIENEGTQVIERGLNGAANGAPRDGSPARRISTPPRVRRRAPKQTSPLDWVGELAFGNPVVKGLQRAAGSTAVALAASLYREAAPGGTDSAEVDYALRGNFLPVPEVGGKVPVRVIEGTVPKGFPNGVYVRNGPNPQYMPKEFRSLTGNLTKYHWFEGDGMLHAVWFKDGRASYQNKFVETEGYVKERDAGKATLMGTLAAENVLENMAVNALTHGFGFKHTANTAVVGHHGSLLALMEAGPPHEVQIDDLKTVGVFDFDGQLDFPFTAHPKVDPRTGDMVFFGYQVTAPFCSVGVVSSTGELVHRTPIDTKRATMMHDFAITEHYNVILDFPLTFSFERMLRGGELIEFEQNQPSRFGVMPRFGGKGSVQWFEAENCFAFHTLNAYEDGNEIVIYACASKNPALNTPANTTPQEHFQQNLTGPDGGLMSRLTEWRVNLKTGVVTEKLLVPRNFTADMPRINENYTGLRNKYGYGLVTNTELTVREGMPLHTEIVKYYLPDSENTQLPIRMELHDFGPDRFASEPSFVPREGATAEDDGWVVCYVFDQSTQTSELVIVDAQKFSGPPVARLALPQRVPFGLHGSYVLT